MKSAKDIAPTPVESVPSFAVPGLGIRISRSMMRYVIATVITFVVNMTVTIVLREVFGRSPQSSFGGALAVVFVFTFLLMRYFIYDARQSSWLRQAAKYCPSALMFRGLEYVAFGLCEGLGQIDYRVLAIGILSVSAVVKYFYYRRVVFRSS